MLSSLGLGHLYLTVMLLITLLCMHIWKMLSFLGTKRVGTKEGPMLSSQGLYLSAHQFIIYVFCPFKECIYSYLYRL